MEEIYETESVRAIVCSEQDDGISKSARKEGVLVDGRKFAATEDQSDPLESTVVEGK